MGNLEIRVMEEQDFDYAVKLTDTAEWGFTPKEFAWMKSLEPRGCFMAIVDGNRAGLTTTISYGDMGWVGNVIVEPKFRSGGIGSKLVQAALRYLQGCGAKRIGLYSYLATVPFYERLGFTGDIKFVRLSADIGEACPAQQPRMRREHLPEAVALDRTSFGAPRERLLEAIYHDDSNRSVCYVADGENHLIGFVMGRVTGRSAEVGPLICPPQAEREAEELLAAALKSLSGRRVYLGVSQHSARFHSMLCTIGFREDFQVLRMWLGGESPKAEEASYRLMESLERG